MNFFMKYVFAVIAIGCVDQLFGYVPTQVQAFKTSIQDTTKVTNCAGCDFRGVQELAGVDAHGVYMPSATFQPCEITAENQYLGMICIPKQAANLTGINLANAHLSSTCFDYAILDKANLSGADLSDSLVVNASLKDANVTGLITTNSTFCDSVMPDGAICKDTWTGQGVTIDCNCQPEEASTEIPATDATSSTPITAPSSASATSVTSTPVAVPAPKST
jgi:hypothetical protein